MDSCILCRYPMDDHSVLTKERKILGVKVKTPIGWLCPGKENSPIVIVQSGGGGGAFEQNISYPGGGSFNPPPPTPNNP